MRFHPLLPSFWGFSFALGRGVSLFGGIQHSPVDGCSVSCNFWVLTGEDEHMSFHLCPSTMPQDLVHFRTQEKEAVTPKRLTQTCLWASRSLWQRLGMVVACCRVRGIECSSVCMGPFEGDSHYLHYPCHSLALGQTTGREHSPTHQQKIGLKIYWAWLHPSEQYPGPPQSVSPIKKLHEALILIHQRAERTKTTITGN